MSTPKQAYIKSLNDIARRYADLDERTTQRIIQLLQEAQSQISTELLSHPDEFNTFRLRDLQRGVQNVIDDFQRRADAELRKALADAHDLGGRSIVDPLHSAGVSNVFYTPNPAQLNVILDFSAALIRNISDEMRSKINRQLQLAVLGQRSPFETMKAITNELGVEVRAGRWATRPDVVKGVAARAEATTRTELTRIFNLAGHSQQQDVARRVPDLMKAWTATGDRRTRQSHLDAHRRYHDNPIPIGEPYKVGGTSLMYPGDPNGPPKETMYCRCTQQTVYPTIGVILTPLNTRINTELKRREDARKAEAVFRSRHSAHVYA